MGPPTNLTNSFRNLHKANFLQPMRQRQSMRADIPIEYVCSDDLVLFSDQWTFVDQRGL